MMQRRLGFEIFPKFTIHDVVVPSLARKWPPKNKNPNWSPVQTFCQSNYVAAMALLHLWTLETGHITCVQNAALSAFITS